MNNLDQRIRDALKSSDDDLFDAFPSEQSLYEMIVQSFRSRHWWLIAIMYVMTLTFFTLSVLCAVQFFTVEDLRVQLWWGAGALLGMLMVGNLKMWYFMELNKNTTSREVKRVELRIARLAQRLEEREAAGD